MDVNSYPGERSAGPDLDERVREVMDFLRDQAMAGADGAVMTGMGWPEVPEIDTAGPYNPEEKPEDVEPGRVRQAGGAPDLAAEAAAAEPTGPIKVARNGHTPNGTASHKFRKPPKARTARDKAVRDRRDDLKPWPYGSREE